MMLFKCCKAVVEDTKRSGGDLSSIAMKIDIFYAAGKLSDTEYQALTNLIAA